MTYLAVPISGVNFERAVEQIDSARRAGAEMLELRIDYLENLNAQLVEQLVAAAQNKTGKALPVIVTCRDKKEGGVIDYPVQLRIEMLVAALKAGAEFIDFEYAGFLQAQNQGRLMSALSNSLKGRLILSAHNFETTFDNITKLHRHILTLFPAAIAKLVYTANNINDCFEGFDLLHRTSGDRIVMAMGAAGLMSRILAKKFGSFLTFASSEQGKGTAPGQLDIETLKGLYRYDSMNENTELYGVIADPVAHSMSPHVHNVCFDELDLNKVYLPLLVAGDTASFDKFMDNVTCRKWMNFKGFSVTIPHKENALNYVKRKRGFVEPLAEKIAAVNTLVVGNEGALKAYNTDYAGALDAITAALKISTAELKDMPVAIIGAGGVARAIVAGLSDAGAEMIIYNRTLERARELAAEFNCSFAPLEALQKIKAKLLINCTSIGMHPDTESTPLPAEYHKRGMAVFDTVYNPAETQLLKDAKKKRTKRIDGLEMFVNQAKTQFRFFTGQDGNWKLMRKTISSRLAK